MSKEAIKFWGVPAAASIFGAGIAWVSSAPWWVILISAIGSPAVLIFLLFVLFINELLKGI